MGYSSTQRADTVRKAIEECCITSSGSANVWYKNNRKYMFEIGREQADGSITGSVYELVSVRVLANENDKDWCYKKGSFKIESNGRIVRFPNMNKLMKLHVKSVSQAQVAFSEGAMFYVT